MSTNQRNEEKNIYLMLAEQLLLETPNVSSAPDDQQKIPNPTIQHYQQVLQQGLPQSDQQPLKDKTVVVVGAGVSGLLTAGLLSQAGAKVEIVEANTRIGGRVKTFTNKKPNSISVDLDEHSPPFKQDGLYAEAGAMRMPISHPLLKYLSQEKLEIPCRDFKLVGEDPSLPENDQTTGATDQDPAWISTFDNSGQQVRVQKKDYYSTKTDETRKKLNACFHVNDSHIASNLLSEAFAPLREMIEMSDNISDPEQRRQLYLEKWAKLLEQYDGYSLQRYLREEAHLTEEQIALIGTLENLTSRLPLSLIHSFLGRFDINPNNHYYEFIGGSWRLPAAIYKYYGLDKGMLKPGRRVVHIDPNKASGNNAAAYSIPENDCSTMGLKIDEITTKATEHEGDALVMTTPFSSLRFISIDKPFSFKKRRAITELHYDSATKVLLSFEKRWWEWDKAEWQKQINKAGITNEEKDYYLTELASKPPTSIRGGGSISEGPSRFIYYPSHPTHENDLAEPFDPNNRGKELPGGVILASYTWADDARRWDSLERDEQLLFALRELMDLHGERIKLFFNHAGATQCWARNPYAFGEAAIFTPGQMGALHPHIPQPEGNVFFAGEHTSLKHAWIEGAIESAVRVSLEVQQFLLGNQFN